MALYLVEIPLETDSEARLTEALDNISNRLNDSGRLVEAQIGIEQQLAYLIIEGHDEQHVQSVVDAVGFKVTNLKEVLLIGQEIDDVHNQSGDANYLVEWNLPEGLTMESYLERKEQKSPLYNEVPEVQFERTYVCTDMSKCLCFYDSPDEQTVKKARDVVEAPIDKLTRVKKAGA